MKKNGKRWILVLHIHYGNRLYFPMGHTVGETMKDGRSYSYRDL